MGTNESRNYNGSEDFKKEYFKKIEQDMNEAMKLVNLTIYQDNKPNYDDDNWIIYFKENLDEFIEKYKAKKENFEYINEIIKYTESLDENEYTNFKYKLKIFLANEIDEIKISNKRNERIYISN